LLLTLVDDPNHPNSTALYNPRAIGANVALLYRSIAIAGLGSLRTVFSLEAKDCVAFRPNINFEVFAFVFDD
jgi:hypothetical protein